MAGIIAAEQGNETGVVGIAPDADIAATRVKWAMPHMIGALQEQVQFDVSNNSWGAVDVFADDFNRADWMMGSKAENAWLSAKNLFEKIKKNPPKKRRV